MKLTFDNFFCIFCILNYKNNYKVSGNNETLISLMFTNSNSKHYNQRHLHYSDIIHHSKSHCKAKQSSLFNVYYMKLEVDQNIFSNTLIYKLSAIAK